MWSHVNEKEKQNDKNPKFQIHNSLNKETLPRSMYDIWGMNLLYTLSRLNFFSHMAP